MNNKRQLDRIELIDLERLEYNKKYGTNYSYGMYTAFVRLKKIRPKRGAEWWTR
ncbi:MAG: hypothetical protein U0L66_05590 [Acutalibacteraceae bacterium]|nr:hypothetical protein [Acutalibacteraceae bacterium]